MWEITLPRSRRGAMQTMDVTWYTKMLQPRPNVCPTSNSEIEKLADWDRIKMTNWDGSADICPHKIYTHPILNELLSTGVNTSEYDMVLIPCVNGCHSSREGVHLSHWNLSTLTSVSKTNIPFARNRSYCGQFPVELFFCTTIANKNDSLFCWLVRAAGKLESL